MLETPDRYVNWGRIPLSVIENRLFSIHFQSMTQFLYARTNGAFSRRALKLKVKPEGLMHFSHAGVRMQILLEVYQR